MRDVLFVGNLKGKSSVAAQQVEIDRLFKTLGRRGNALVFELDLALSALVVLGTDIVVHDLEAQDHVVESGNVKSKGLVPDGVAFARLCR